MRPPPLPTSETLIQGVGSNGVDNCTPMCRQRSLARGLGDLSTILQKVHVQEKAYLLQPAVVSRGTLNSQQTFTPMTSARAFRSHCLQLSVPFYLNATPQAIERRSICPLNSTHRPKVKSSQVNTLPKAKSKTRSKQDKDMHKCSSVYSERGVPLPVLTSGGE